MALESNINIDQNLETIVLTVTKNPNPVETIRYSNQSKEITFDSRPDITIALDEFIDYTNKVGIFQAAIMINFAPSTTLVYPFDSCNTLENYDTNLNKWNYVCIFGPTPRVCNYSCDIATLMVDLASRGNLKTINFNTWLYWFMNFNHYRASLKGI